jgi:hypothetical protein
LAGWVTQFAALGKREFQNVIRDKASLAARFGIAAALNIIFACIFLNIGDANKKDYDLYSHFGAIMFAAIFSMIGSAQPVVLLFPFERPLFVREYANGTQHPQESVSSVRGRVRACVRIRQRHATFSRVKCMVHAPAKVTGY